MGLSSIQIGEPVGEGVGTAGKWTPNKTGVVMKTIAEASRGQQTNRQTDR